MDIDEVAVRFMAAMLANGSRDAQHEDMNAVAVIAYKAAQALVQAKNDYLMSIVKR